MRAFPRRGRDIIRCDTRPGQVRPAEAGGKGWNLLRLRAGGFPVPQFLVLSSRVFERALRPCRREIEAVIAAADLADREASENASLRIGQLVLAADIPARLVRELGPALERLAGGGRLAVRSSVVGEDSVEHSFAGQMDSFLDLAPGEALGAVRRVWASAFSARALRYRCQKGLPLDRISAAVIVQQMVGPQASGVLFTRDPETGRPECVVVAGFGRGDAVVTDRIETDTYRMPDGGDGRLTKAISSVQVLPDDDIRALCGLGREVEKRFGLPQDIEWARDGRGRLFLLQARPIVFASVPRRDEDLRVWDNSNIIESYPGLTLPLTFSFVRECYGIVFRDVARAIDPSGRGLAAREDVYGNMLGHLGGRVYYNLLNWYEMLSYLPGFDRHRGSWDRMIGIAESVPFPEKKGSAWSRLRAAGLIARRLLSVGRTQRRFFAAFDKAYSAFGARDFSGESAAGLAKAYDGIRRAFAGHWHLTQFNDFCAMTYFEALRRMCSRRPLAGLPNLHNDLLCGQKGVESAAPVRSLLRLAWAMNAEPSRRRLLTGMDERSAWSEIVRDPGLEPLKKMFEDHLGRYGDRGMEELKLETPTFREAPELLVGLVKRYLELGLTVEAMEARETEVRRRAEAAVRAGFKDPFRRLAFRFVLGNARRAIAGRENMRFARARLFGVVRRLTRRAGVLFAETGLIDAPADVHYLTIDEVLGTARGTAAGSDLRALVALRKSEYEAFAGLDLKDRFVTRGLPASDLPAGDGPRPETGRRLKGVNCSAGVAEGTARIIDDPRAARPDGRTILVARSTDPGWVFLMAAARGIVVERGSVLSHTAIIGRELGIPTIVGVRDATRLIPDGARLVMDGSTGEITWR